MGACGLLVLGAVTHDTGAVGFLIGLSLALLPLPVVVWALRWLLFRRREFDGVVDGIVLAGLSGLGFAFTENVLYFGRAFLAGQEQSLTTGFFAVGFTFVLRGVLSPFAHPLFTAMTGIGLG